LVTSCVIGGKVEGSIDVRGRQAAATGHPLWKVEDTGN
jgi:hypothetical protein